MSTKTNITIKPGDDISWGGIVERTGVTDFTGYVLKAQFRLRDPASGAVSTLLADATIEWLDEVEGTFLLTVARAITATWPSGATVLMDVSVLDADGARVRTETVEFKTEAGVTELV